MEVEGLAGPCLLEYQLVEGEPMGWDASCNLRQTSNLCPVVWFKSRQYLRELAGAQQFNSLHGDLHFTKNFTEKRTA